MSVFTEYEQRLVAEAIARAERRTDAELVSVLARRADEFAYLPLFCAALLALLVPGLLHLLLGWPSVRGLLVAQLVIFVALCLLLRHPRLGHRLMPRCLCQRTALSLARQQFRALERQRNHGTSSLLIFVSQAENFVTILTDRGIEQHFDPRVRAALIARFTEQVRQGQTLQGFVECIDACAEQLSRPLPATQRRNQLPNRLVILD